jgi:hypothetical protein
VAAPAGEAGPELGGLLDEAGGEPLPEPADDPEPPDPLPPEPLAGEPEPEDGGLEGCDGLPVPLDGLVDPGG